MERQIRNYSHYAEIEKVMRILITAEFYEPYKCGITEVTKQLAERWVEHGHTVTVATSFLPYRTFENLNGVHIEQFHITGNRALGISGTQDEIKRYQDFLCRDWDIVLQNAAQEWTVDAAFDVLPRMRAKKVLIPCGYSGLRQSLYAGYYQGYIAHMPLFIRMYERLKNFAKAIIHTLRGSRMRKPDYTAYYQELPRFLKQYDSLVYMSPSYQDKLFGDEHGVGDKAMIIPNGADEREFCVVDERDARHELGITTPHIVITVANHYIAKGHDFVIRAFERMRRTDTTLLIIGTIPSVGLKHIGHMMLGCYPYCKFSSMVNKNIRLVNGSDRGLIVSAYKQADAFLFGSYIEYAPLVMYESFASHTPFITRNVGNVSDHAEFLKIVKTPEEMAAMANNFLNHPHERAVFADSAFHFWLKHHTWAHIAKQYEELFGELLDKG